MLIVAVVAANGETPNQIPDEQSLIAGWLKPRYWCGARRLAVPKKASHKEANRRMLIHRLELHLDVFRPGTGLIHITTERQLIGEEIV